MGKDILKVIGLQFGIFLAHQLGLYFFVIKMHHPQFAPLEMILVCMHWFVLLILMIVFFATRKTGKAIGYLISFICLLVIGFGSCAFMFWGNDEPVQEAPLDQHLIEEIHRQDSFHQIDLHNDSVQEGLLPRDSAK